MNYCEEDGHQVIKLMAKVCLRDDELIISLEMATFFWSFLICSG